MRRSGLARAAIVLVLGAVGVGAWLLFFAGGSGEPSTELTTPGLPGADSTTTLAGSVGASTTSHGTTEPIVFVVDPEHSAAVFELDESLRGSPNRVVGTTNQIAGQVKVDPADISAAVFSQIVVNARTFETDSPRRDQAMRGPIILDSGSDEHELITFDVTSTSGPSGAVVVGDTVRFGITGDLTIRGSTNEVTFDVEVTFQDEATITGSASVVVLRSAFGIGIPSVPGVADVSDEVRLRLTFRATAG